MTAHREWTERHIRELVQSELKKLKPAASGFTGVLTANRNIKTGVTFATERILSNLYMSDEVIHINPDDLNNVMTGKKTMREKNAMSATAEKAAKGEKFKFGKGKVAMAVMGLAGLAGVTGLMFSGGRQQNSNLYNANQAMY